MREDLKPNNLLINVSMIITGGFMFPFIIMGRVFYEATLTNNGAFKLLYISLGFIPQILLTLVMLEAFLNIFSGKYKKTGSYYNTKAVGYLVILIITILFRLLITDSTSIDREFINYFPYLAVLLITLTSYKLLSVI